MTAHRAWRIFVDRGFAGADTYSGSMEIQLRETIGGPQAAVGGTAEVAPLAVGTAAGVFDGVVLGDWYSVDMPSWVSYDFGAGNAKDIVEVVLSPEVDANYSIADFRLQYSDDLINWLTKFTVVDLTGWTARAQVKIYNADSLSIGANRRYRLNITADVYGGTFIRINTLTMHAVVSGGNICTSGKGIASSQDSFYDSPSNLFDGSGNSWAANADAGSQWVGYEFPYAVQIAEISIGGFDTDVLPKDFTWEVWNGGAWQVLQTFTGVTSYVDDVPKLFAVALADALPTGDFVQGVYSGIEVGSDQFAATGSILFNLQANEVGDDVFAAFGNVEIRGALTAAENNVDVFVVNVTRLPTVFSST